MNDGFKFSIVLSVQPTRFPAVALNGDVAANLAKIAAWGYDGVELTIRDPRLVDAAELNDLVSANGLSVPAIGTGQAWGEEGLSFSDANPEVRRAAVERVKLHVPLARQFDAVLIIGLLRGIVQPGIERAQAWTWVVEALRECCEAAGEQGVRMAIEPINRYETPLVNSVADGLDIINEVAAPNLGVMLDTFHANIEDVSIEASLRDAGERLYHVHVADSNRRHPGAGHLDFAALLRVLDQVGYRGFVSGEFMPWPDGETAAEKGLRYLRTANVQT